MDQVGWRFMGRGLGQLSGALAVILALGRLGRLFEGGPDTPPWQLILVASAFLGGVAWWLLSQLSSRLPLKLSIFSLGAVLLALRISVPQTLIGGVLPSGSTPGVLGAELDLAWRTVQTGIPPVEPYAGLLAILAVLLWATGAFFTWGSTGGPYAALFAPPLVLYYQFAVFDRIEAGLGWMIFSTLALALAVISMSLERHTETGRARDTDGRPLARRSMVLAAVMASVLGIASMAVANSASDVIDEFGNVPWRSGTGLGPGPGEGVSYDGLVELKQRILNQSETPVFTARLGNDTPADINPYWKVDTLDTFNGEEWSRSDTSNRPVDPDQPVVEPSNLYQGTTTEILQTVRIQALRGVLAPRAGTPVEVQNPGQDADSPLRAEEFYTVGEVSLGVAGGLGRSDQYQLRTSLVDRTADLGALATDSSGELSPIFAEAQQAGAFPHQAQPASGDLATLPDREHYLQLPLDTPSAIGSLARQVAAGASTDFEAAWMLQSWFRDEGNFTYSTEVSTGHDSLVLNEWLSNPESTNYRTGYCEQFAAAMAVLARELDMPARVVWGFTPGEVDDNGTITVRDTNAHAWVELWIEPYGWFPFDPTPRAEETGFESQPPSLTAALDPDDYLEAPEDNPATETSVPDALEQPFGEVTPEPLQEPTDTLRGWLVPLVAVVMLGMAIPVFKKLRRRRRLTKVRNGDITAVWDEIVDRLTDLGVDVEDSMTPVEVARSTNHSLLPLAHSYSATVYGGRTGQARETDLVDVEWWIERTYEGKQRTRAAFSLRSLVRRL
ncbi:MAG: transglutaminaseTgpA domain-containing protein [Actinomycetota bacterium]